MTKIELETTMLINLDPIEQRLAAATPGSWRAVGNYPNNAIDTGDPKEAYDYQIICQTYARDDPRQASKDFEFMAHAKKDVADLVKEVRYLRANLSARCEHVFTKDNVCATCGATTSLR